MLLAAAGDEDDGDIGNEASKTFVNCWYEESYMIPHIRNVKRESMKWKKGNKKSIKCLGLSGQDQDSVGKSPGGS